VIKFEVTSVFSKLIETSFERSWPYSAYAVGWTVWSSVFGGDKNLQNVGYWHEKLDSVQNIRSVYSSLDEKIGGMN